MLRRILGFALLAIVALVALKLVFAVLGLAIGLAMTLLLWAAVGYIIYLGIRIVSPNTANRLREMIRGRSA